MRKARFAAALAVSALLLAVPTAGTATPGGSTHVDSVSATVGSSVVNVTGTATFVDTPFVVSQDGTGDASPAGIGADINVATIARPVGSNNLVFKWTIADMLPAPVTSVPAVVYEWPLAVNGEDLGFFLMAGRAGGGFSPTANPVTALMQDGADGFSTVARLAGTFGPAEVSWTLPLSRISGKTGDTISQGGAAPAGTVLGNVETVWINQPFDSFFAEDYIVPGAIVKLGMATAGTPVNEVVLTNNAGTVNPTTGAFSGTITKPVGASGPHVVVAQACYSADVCGTASTTVTL